MQNLHIRPRDSVLKEKKREMRRSCGRNSFLLLLLRRGEREKKGKGQVEGAQETVKTKMIVQSANKTKQNKTGREWEAYCIQVITQYFRPNQSARDFPEEQGRLRVTGMPIENFRKAEVDSYRVISLLHHLFFSFGVTGIYKDAPLH